MGTGCPLIPRQPLQPGALPAAAPACESACAAATPGLATTAPTGSPLQVGFTAGLPDCAVEAEQGTTFMLRLADPEVLAQVGEWHSMCWFASLHCWLRKLRKTAGSVSPPPRFQLYPPFLPPPTPFERLQIVEWLSQREGTTNTGLTDGVRKWLSEAQAYIAATPTAK